MNYHLIKHDDQNNGEGLRVTLFVSGCEHHCPECQNPETWDKKSGIPFNDDAMWEICNELNKDYISGVTLSGGDPLMPCNIDTIKRVIYEAVNRNKSVWLYTGYSLDNLLLKGLRADVLDFIDVLVDGEYKKDLRDTSLKWRGSSNQRVIDMQRTFKEHKVVLWCD